MDPSGFGDLAVAGKHVHAAFDAWIRREYPAVQFERYCDDVIVHARSEQHAQQLRDAIASRLAECGLALNERKTRIVYCKDADRRGSHEHDVGSTFSGYTFRPQPGDAAGTGTTSSASRPAVRWYRGATRMRRETPPLAAAPRAATRPSRTWRDMLNPRRSRDGSTTTGGSTRPALYPTSPPPQRLSSCGGLVREYKRLRRHARPRAAGSSLSVATTAAGPVRSLALRRAPCRLDDGSPVSREAHAGI